MSGEWDRARLDTVQLVPPTPFSADGRDLLGEKLGMRIEKLAAAGIDVFLPAAGTGEFHSLSVDEVVTCVRIARAAAPAAIVVAPVGFGLAHAVAIGQRASAAGANALLLMPPVHPYLCDSGFRDYVHAIREGVDLPMLAYKRGPVPSDRLLLELGQSGQLLGVKYAVNDVDAFARFAAMARGRVGLYCGTAERWAPYFMLAGATGYTSGIGSVAPHVTLAMHRALQARDFVTAQRWLDVLRPLEDFRARDADSYNIVAVKYAVSALGDDFGPCRPPQRRLTAEEQSEIRRLLEPLRAADEQLSR
ncbi:MAG: dihydrodipicolinate synthase family protein [Pirellulaceae bacterium]